MVLSFLRDGCFSGRCSTWVPVYYLLFQMADEKIRKREVAAGPSDETVTMNVSYSWHNGTDLLTGRTFNISPVHLQFAQKSPSGSFIHLDSHTVETFVFATGASANHFNESIDAIARIQLYMPNHTIMYYDLGLRPWQVDRVSISLLISIHPPQQQIWKTGS